MDGFPDVELALCELLEEIGPTYTATDEELVAPVILINRTGGSTDRLGIEDAAAVEVQCFGDTRPDSVALNNQVRNALSGARGVETSAGFLDKITETSAPIPIPYPNQDVRLVSSTWTVTSRIQSV